MEWEEGAVEEILYYAGGILSLENQVGQEERADIKQIEFGKVRHCFSLFHTNLYLTRHLIQLQNKTVHVE